MSTGEDEPSSGLNGRLRPRRTNIPSPQSAKVTRKPDAKLAHDKPKRTTTPSKVFPNKFDDLTDKSDSPAPQILCPYCDRIFSAKQAVSKHIRSTHLLIHKQDHPLNCLFCNHNESDGNKIIRHMVDNHPNQYFACYDCHTRFPSTTELAEHKLNVCERQKIPYRNKLRQKTTPKKDKNTQDINGRNDYSNNDKSHSTGQPTFNGIVISCELKPSHAKDPTDIEDNITTNLILPPNKSLSNATVIEKSAIIVLDDFQWNKRIPNNFSFPNTDADQILSRLGVVHRSPRTSESNRREWFKTIDESTQKFEKCFDTSFYSKVASNVQENLTKFLDGSFNFNPDAEHTIKTRKAKNSVAINTVEGFPILLACDQFNRNIFDAYMPRAIAPKHKWKWENLDNDKTLMSPEQIKRDSHTFNCIISLVSSLDIWTQLCMRRKFEEKFNKSPVEKKIEKQTIIGKELKEILESRELPTSSRQLVKCKETPQQVRSRSDFPASLGLVPAAPNYNYKPAVLSGEWVRPRCYVCCACGAQSRDSKGLASHINNHHPNAQIEHYEIVGEVLLNSDILKHLYVPPSQINNRSRPLRGFRECTKCKISITLDDLHQHMLDCAGDTPTVRRKCRHRPFGMRKRRPRIPDNTIRKKMRKDIRSRHNSKNHLRPRQKIRSEVGDAETIRKMLADLPAKRHRVMVNPLNPIMRPRRKLNKQRNKLVMKKRIFDEPEKKEPVNALVPDSSIGGDGEDPKSSSKQVDRKTIKTKVKRVASKLLRHKDSLTKKATMRRSRRKGIPCLESKSGVESSDVPLQPSDGDSQNEQRSNDNNPERTNPNDGSRNGQERSNSDNGSNNRDRPPEGRGENNNSNNGSAPTQNVPLKHSIARLTANSDTQDKSLQFHHLFLVHQQCNDNAQHLSSEERMLFENEAVVTKLDKPPLHFCHQELQEDLPFQQQYLPIQQEDLPIQQQYLPIQQENLPIQQQYLPIQQEDLPIQQEYLPIQPDLPTQQENLPIEQEDLPVQQEDLPIQQKDLPIQQKDLPIQQEDLPTQQEYLPVQQEDIPIQQEDLPIQREDLPIQQEDLPIQQEDLPIQQEDLPIQQEDLPIQQEDLAIQQEEIIQSSLVTQEVDAQKNKLNKRKGLNDCIAMLKNKLVEPSLSPPPRHVSVQCGTDEPLGPEPPPMERRYSTTDVNLDSWQRSMLMHYQDKSLDDVRRSCDTSTRVTRRSHSARGQSRKEKRSDIIVDNEYLQWKLYYENQMYAAQKTNEQYTRRETSRRRSVVSSDDILMRHAISLDILTSNPLSNLSEFQYPNPVTPQKSSRRSRGNRSKSRSKSTTTKDTRIPQEINSTNIINPPPRSRRNTRRKAEQSSTPTRSKKRNDLQNENITSGSLTTVENIVHTYPEHAISGDRSNIVMESSMLAPNTYPDEQSYQSALLYQNNSIIQYNNESDIRPFHYSAHNVESIIAAPLDLSKRPQIMEQESGVRYVSEPQCCPMAYDGYETLDLSNRHANQLLQQDIHTQETREDIVDLRVNYMSHLDHSSNLTSFPQNMSHLDHSSNLTSLPQDMSLNIIENNYLSTLNSQDDYYPTDLSVKRTNTEIDPYENRLHENMGDINMVQDLSHSMMHSEHMCAVDREREYIVIEEPTDLSQRRHQSSSISLSAQRMDPNICSNNQNLYSNDVPADLSARSKDIEEGRLYMDSQSPHEYYEAITVNNKIVPVRNISEPPLSVNCMTGEHLMDVHYDSTTLMSHQNNNPNSRTIVGYPNSNEHRTIGATDEIQDISTSNLISTPHLKSDVIPTINGHLLNTNDPHKEVAYSHINVPLSLSINSVPNVRNLVQNETESNLILYEHNQQTFVAPSVTSYHQIEPLNAVKTNINNLPADHNLSTETFETNTNPSNVSSSVLKINRNNSKRKSQDETADLRKYKSRKRSSYSNDNPSEDNEKRHLESNKSDSLKPILDNDPETARKIAMLPKELVDIIGNMPIDHCKQLLNVLPQYVSTSSSPGSISNNKRSMRNNTCNLMTDLTSPTESNKRSEIEYKTEIKSDEGQNYFSNIKSSQNSQRVDTSPSTVSSSILLTPPTPQLRSMSHEVSDTSLEYRRKSRTSTDDQFPLKIVESEKLLVASNTSLNKKFTSDENDTKDRIIDLTMDDSIPEKLNTFYYTSDPSIRLIPLPSAVASNAQKTNSDKTASLRAVRIKAPSERHRSILAKSTELKGATDVNINVKDGEEKNIIVDTINPMAIQQAEISSTQHRTVPRASPISPTYDYLHKEKKIISEQALKEKDDVKESELDKNCNLKDKQNIVSSSHTKNVNIDKNTSFTQKDNMLENSIHVRDISQSEKTTVSGIHDKDNMSTKNEINEEKVEGATILKDHSMEDDDSEDDVTLAVIVKQKNQNTKSSTEKDNNSVNKKNKQINKATESVEISKDSSSQCKNGVLLIDNMSLKEADKTKNLSESSKSFENLKDIKVTEDTLIEKVTSVKKKSRKGRKGNNLNASNIYLEQEQELYHGIAENELNKENNVSSKIINYKESIEDLVQINANSDICLSNTPNQKTVNVDKEICSRLQSNKKERVTKVTEIIAECSTDCTDKQVCNQSFELMNNEKNVDQEASKVITCPTNITLISSNASSTSDPVTEDNNSVMKYSAKSPEKLSSEDLNSTDILPESNLKKQYNIEHIISNKEKNPKNKLTFKDTSSDNHEVNETEEASTTPLRRSRRGKSLFIDNTSNANVLQVETPTEQRAPLTKKQLIFSKLLLDEENHKSSINALNPQTPTDDITLVGKQPKDSYEFTCDSDIEQEPLNKDQTKSYKRKKSPLFKRRSKKQRLLTNPQSATKDNSVTSVIAASVNNDVVIIAADSEISIPHSIPPSDRRDKTDSKSDKIHTQSKLPMEDSSNKQKINSAEKRRCSSPRCSSPSRSELPSSQSKKTKLDDNENKDTADTCDERTEVVTHPVQNKDDNEGVTAIVVSQNTPCCNKPSARRARSKSVVVKSSGAELYDPYDINLEDMVEKTEPYVRKEISTKIGLKSSIAVKTRKLSKTAPAAIIDISPSNCSDINQHSTKQNIESDNLIKQQDFATSDQSNTTINKAKESSCDSDDSSKSDVPLKKYVEQKEKKLSEEPNKLSSHLENNDNSHNLKKRKRSSEKLKSRKKNKRTKLVNNKKEEIQNKEDSEKELRSEKFMESFGFFSERKPRKSNLLATKKISETFHIIANEGDDVYPDTKERNSKKGSNDAKKEDVKSATNKKSVKRGRKKKNEPPPKPAFCDVCIKAFRRFDNYARHQMSLIHISKVSEVELKVDTVKIEEEPNYLIAYKLQLDRLKILQNKIAKRKKNCISTADIILPTLQEILAEVKRIIDEQQLSRRGLSRDQELFIDCCEMLKESHKNDQAPVKRIRNCNSFNCAVTCQEELALLERSISDDRCDIKSDGDVDSITAKNILESEEVRNLENDLIFNLKEANKLKASVSNVEIKPQEEYTSNEEQPKNYDEESHQTSPKPQIEIKDKMYPDVAESIDMFEDKFDKIKRKCRSKAAAAKQKQTRVELKLSHKNRKKSERKKGKRISKKCRRTVPTKGALKGFDGIKVSILTSDINLSAIVPPVGNTFKKKKKSSSKKKRERCNSNETSKSDSNNYSKDTPQKEVDVYEFMDTEDTELFEFRPSTLMERFKSISNKDIAPSTSKTTVNEHDLVEISSESGSDGDDFVYMSDDYVCSDDETENSMLSCELGTGPKKATSLLKRKDVTEKNAVMGKIFKNNAVRSERRSPKRRETPKPAANLDQLFDSLLQELPIPPSAIKSEDNIKKDDPPLLSRSNSPSPTHCSVQSAKYDKTASTDCLVKSPVTKDMTHDVSTPDTTNYPATSSKKRKSITPPKKLDLNLISNTIEYELLAPNRKDHFRRYDTNKERRNYTIHSDALSKKCVISQSEEEDDSSSEEVSIPRHEPHAKHETQEQSHPNKIYPKNKEEVAPKSVQSSEYSLQTLEDEGVARQRARRKCTVGKQNVLAETWSSESEPDGVPPRPNSAESVIGGGRKKKGRKKEFWGVRKVNRVVKKARVYGASSHWSAGEEEPEPQQHGWIVGDSHKKLVTMLAHAKGRKRNDDKQSLLE